MLREVCYDMLCYDLDVLIMYATLRLAKHLAKTFRCTLHFAKCAMLCKNFQKKRREMQIGKHFKKF